jgi:hypothetical protein
MYASLLIPLSQLLNTDLVKGKEEHCLCFLARQTWAASSSVVQGDTIGFYQRSLQAWPEKWWCSVKVHEDCHSHDSDDSY